LLANDSDADNDPLVATVNVTSSNGASITVSNDWVYYTPATGCTSADSFTYMITDGRGASALGTVIVAIETNNFMSQNLVITALGNNQFLIEVGGIPGQTYQLQYSDSAHPFIWQALTNGILTAGRLGRFQYTDTSTTPMRFYISVSL
jgi:hypothetical protein